MELTLGSMADHDAENPNAATPPPHQKVSVEVLEKNDFDPEKKMRPVSQSSKTAESSVGKHPFPSEHQNDSLSNDENQATNPVSNPISGDDKKLSGPAEQRPSKRIRSKEDSSTSRTADPSTARAMKTPDMATEQTSTWDASKAELYQSSTGLKRAPVAQVTRNESSASVSSDISSASSAAHQTAASYNYQEADEDYDDDDDPAVLSPVPRSFVQEVPPAPPSTPASSISPHWDDGNSGTLTPLPIATLKNAQMLEEEQMLMEGAVTPAPPRDVDSGGEKRAARNIPVLPGEFEDWAVGDRYEMVRILGRGSYGEVAQAKDLSVGRPDAFVAIKRIQSPFDQEVDSIRLYREMHILRHMRGHDCIIQLLNVIQPPTDDLDDFHDLYLVFECKYAVSRAFFVISMVISSLWNFCRR